MLIHDLTPGQTRELSVYATDVYSLEQIKLTPGKRYELSCDVNQYWTDLIIPASPNGYWNLLADFMGKRVPDAPTFSLCGSFNADESRLRHFGAGTHILQPDEDVVLSFFANDVPGFYHNNYGFIRVQVRCLN